MNPFLDQYQTMVRVQDLTKQYGLKKSWIADKIGISNSLLSRFICGKSVLNAQQINRLTRFIDSWEVCMKNFNSIY